LPRNVYHKGGPEMRDDERAAIRVEAKEISFGSFRLTRTPLRLWRGRREVRLQPRQLAVLHYLVEHADAVVSREELLKTVWRGTIVTPAALQVCVRAIRAALGDEVEAPRYIATVGREGYRFIASLNTPSPVQSYKVYVQTLGTRRPVLSTLC
jgi:DNA-binding winged helix-turn-helix (wHTH) protein